jgi:hypothetical protein
MKPATDDELYAIWAPCGGNAEGLRAVYNLGARHGRQQAAEDPPLWPEPIKDRPPTKDDLDAIGFVQVLDERGNWTLGFRQEAVKGRWRHTPNWQPKPPTRRELALQFLGTIEASGTFLPEITGTIRAELEAQP